MSSFTASESSPAAWPIYNGSELPKEENPTTNKGCWWDLQVRSDKEPLSWESKRQQCTAYSFNQQNYTRRFAPLPSPFPRTVPSH